MENENLFSGLDYEDSQQNLEEAIPEAKNDKQRPVIMVTPEMFKEMNALQEISPDNIVPISSQIVNKAKMNLSLNAQRILRVLYSLIKPSDLPGRTYRFNLTDFANVFGMNTNKIHSNINQACTELRTTFTLPIGKGRVTGLISQAQINDNEVQINLDPALLAIYKKELDTRYYLKCIKELAYSQSFKFYELFMLKLGSNDHVTFTIDVEDLKEWLQINDKYPIYADFKRRILIPTIDDINGNKTRDRSRIVENNMCNIRVSFEEYKEYRKVVSIIFSVTRLKDREVEDIVVDDFYSSLSAEGQDAYNWLRDIVKVNHSAVVHSVNLYGEDKFIQIYKYLGEVLNTPGSNIHNPGAFAATCLRKGYFNEIKPSNKDYELEKLLAERKEVAEKLSEYGIKDRAALIGLLAFSDEHIQANIDYCVKKYQQDKTPSELASLIMSSIPRDYAGYEHKKQLLEEEARVIQRKQMLKQRFAAMTDEELEAYTGESETEAKIELERRMEQRRLDAEARIEIAFEEFLEEASEEERNRYKELTLTQISPFIREHTAAYIQRKDLENASLDELLKAKSFESAFKALWKEEYKKSL